MKPRHFWWLVEDDLISKRSKGGGLDKSDVRRLRRMMEKKQNELAATQGPNRG